MKNLLICCCVLLISACTSPEVAERNSVALMKSLDIKVKNIHCVRPYGAIESAYCTLKTTEGQVYTTHCIYEDCNVERGPGQ